MRAWPHLRGGGGRAQAREDGIARERAVARGGRPPRAVLEEAAGRLRVEVVHGELEPGALQARRQVPAEMGESDEAIAHDESPAPPAQSATGADRGTRCSSSPW